MRVPAMARIWLRTVHPSTGAFIPFVVRPRGEWTLGHVSKWKNPVSLHFLHFVTLDSISE